jgi:hypothetical protein
MDNALPCPYFLITFTVPAALRRFLRGHQETGYRALFAAASQALKKLARDPRFVGAEQLGFTGVLHTWGRSLQYHPHLHFIVAAGGLDDTRCRWRASRADLFVHVRPLSVVYRAKFRDVMKQAGLLNQIPPEVWQQPWVVNSQAVAEAGPTLKYLARYVFRVAICDSRILDWDNGCVTFRYQQSGSHRCKTMTLDAMEFIRRFLQHVLPSGFMKVRHYGFLSSNAATPIHRIRQMICLLYDVIRSSLPAPQPVKTPRRTLRCSACGHAMQREVFVPAVLRTG